ncbi:MAG TPA: prepilin-type cleavage/methylation domain-containing protein, partial [Candidatus Kerfeldbacteria bacterium]|nr:prepilin-type cleavage/methylation domain-containing protein [Candidatus Kerfeldbacteria bacterium]
MAKNGFTLIELIIVIAIIAVLAVVIFVTLPEFLAKARDAQRLA